MHRRRPDQGWRATAFLAALFAITLNFFQPLAHASAMRAGAPWSPAWAAMCLPGEGGDETDRAPTAASRTHECCLGLAHSVTLAAPTAVFTVVSPIALAAGATLPDTDVPPTGGIRDGPGQPRGPPRFD